MDSRSLENTDPMSEGAAEVSCAAARVSSTGNRELIKTATNAAMNVAARYKITTTFMAPAPLALASALMTRKNTRMGATPFSAETNSVPNISSTSLPGQNTPSTAPMIRPTRMRLIRLMPFHFRPIAFKVSISIVPSRLLPRKRECKLQHKAAEGSMHACMLPSNGAGERT